jgi:hypothetical protein
MVNPDLYTESYAPDDMLAPRFYTQDYLFAAVMLSNPLFWMELQFLSAERREELAPIMRVWKEHRATLSKADVMPIGERPTGCGHTGFYVSTDGKPQYLLLFREMSEKESAEVALPIDSAEAEVLYSNAEVKVEIKNKKAFATFSKPRAYAFIKLK